MSLPVCPECEAELEDDFGLVECSSCGVQVLVGEDVVVAEAVAHEKSSEHDYAEEVITEDLFQEDLVESDVNEPHIEVDVEEDMPEFLAEIIDEPTAELTNKQESENPLGDIEAFANEELTADGSLVYDLTIEGVDTPEIRNALVEILKDSKFQWDIEELVASIKLGVLNIYSLNPVKAYLVVTQARRLPIKLAWKQRSVI